MSNRVKLIIFLLLILLGIGIGYFVIEDYPAYYPIAILALMTFLLADRIITRILVKRGHWQGFGRKSINAFSVKLNTILGCLWLVMGLMADPKDYMLFNLDYRIYIGLAFLTAALAGWRNYAVIIKTHTLLVNGDTERSDYRIEMVDRIERNTSKLVFHKGKRKNTVGLDYFKAPEVEKLMEELTGIFGDRIETK